MVGVQEGSTVEGGRRGSSKIEDACVVVAPHSQQRRHAEKEKIKNLEEDQETHPSAGGSYPKYLCKSLP